MMFKKLILLAVFFLLCKPMVAQELDEYKVPSLETIIDSTKSMEENFKMLSGFKDKVGPNEGSIVHYQDTDSLYNFKDNTTTLSEPGYGTGAANELFDKLTLMPKVGNFDNLINVNDDLNSGKVSVKIPLFDFQYFEYKIPVYLNNRYPENIKNTLGDPTFYVGSRVGGDWTLSIDNYKVTRKVNGVNDDDPSKGYFTSYSQSKVNGTNNISNGDVLNGLKGNWDTSPDIYYFNTPTVSGSFLLDLNSNTFHNLSDENFYVTFTRVDNKLNSFTITDDQGNKYLFGQAAEAVEITRTRTAIQNFYIDKGVKPKLILKFHDDGIGYKLDGVVGGVLNPLINLYLTNCTTYVPNLPMSDSAILDAIYDNDHYLNFNNNYLLHFLCDMGEVDGFKYYAIPQSGNRLFSFDQLHLDSDLAQPDTNTSWFLKETQLLNGKKIIFSYVNRWAIFTTHSRSRVEVERADGNPHFPNLPSYGTRFYNAMPYVFDQTQAPINESISNSDIFVKMPILTSIQDEDGISMIQIDNVPQETRTKRPYVVSPTALYTPAPSDIVAQADYNPSLIKKIHFENRNNKNIDVIFNQTMAQYIVNGARIPWNERSTLDNITINNEVNYNFQYYQNGLLKKIIYPTKGEKDFKYVEYPSSLVTFDLPVGVSQPFPLFNDFFVDEVTTTSENNTEVEKYERNTILLKPSGRKSFYLNYNSFGSALMTSSSIISPEFTIKNDYVFANAKKYVNGQLRINSDYKNETQSTSSNFFYKVGSSTPMPAPSGTLNYYENKMGILDKKSDFKKDALGLDVEVSSTQIGSNYYSNGNLLLPAIYLVNFEAGYSSYVNRGYSRYYFPTNVDRNQTTTKTKQVFPNTGVMEENVTQYFKRFKTPLGTNSKVLYFSKYDNSKGEYWRDSYVYGNDSPYLSFSNPVFNNFRLKNLNPPLESIRSKYYAYYANPSVLYNYKPIDINVSKYKLIQNGATTYPVKSSDLTVETNQVVNNLANDGYINSPGSLASISQDPNNVYNILYDNKVKEKIIYDQYDSYGRLIEYHNPDGAYTSIIWGYEDQYPIAKIENARYNDIISYVPNLKTLSNQDNDDCRQSTCKEEILRTALNNFRGANLGQNWMITTYTYDYTIGMTSTTSPSGETKYFEYDAMHKLKKELDSQGNIIKEYEYNYKH